MESQEVKVSVIIPIYNGERYLSACLDSVLKQTIENYEIICVDDGSYDGSYKILEEYAGKYNNLKIFHTKNQGVWKAREFGIKCAAGEYIGFVDCDDVIHEDMFRMMYDKAKQNNAEMCVTAYYRIYDNKKQQRNVEMNIWKNKVLDMSEYRGILPLINTAVWNKLIRHDVIENHISLEKPPRVAEDMMFLLSIYPYINKIAFIAEPLYNYYIRGNSAMTYVDVSEIELWKTDMHLVQEKVLSMQKANFEEWLKIIQIFVLVHLGVSMMLRCKHSDVKKCINHVYDYLNNYIPSWWRNKISSSMTKSGVFKLNLINFWYKTRMIYLVGAFSKMLVRFIKW